MRVTQLAASSATKATKPGTMRERYDQRAPTNVVKIRPSKLVDWMEYEEERGASEIRDKGGYGRNVDAGQSVSTIGKNHNFCD